MKESNEGQNVQQQSEKGFEEWCLKYVHILETR